MAQALIKTAVHDCRRVVVLLESGMFSGNPDAVKNYIVKKRCIRIKAGLSRDFPVCVGGKDTGVTLAGIAVSEDLPALALDIEEAAVCGNMVRSYFRADCRSNTTTPYTVGFSACETNIRVFMLCAEYVNEANLRFLDGVIADVTFCPGSKNRNKSVGDNPADDLGIFGGEDTLPKLARVTETPFRLSNILGKEYLSRIQLPFKMCKGVYSAIFDGDGDFFCGPADTGKNTGFDPEKYKFSKKVLIKINKSAAAAAVWVIAAQKEEIIQKYEPLLDTLASTLARISNAYIMLDETIDDARRSNILLSENIQQQIFVNDIYSSALSQASPQDAVYEIMNKTGDYLNTDRIVVLADKQDEQSWEIRFETGKPPLAHPPGGRLKFAEFPCLYNALEYSDIYFSGEKENELEKYGAKSFAAARLFADGIKYGIVIFEYHKNIHTVNSRESKILRTISQITAMLTLRCQMGMRLEYSAERLRYTAYNDITVGTPNRAKLDEDLSAELGADRDGSAIALKITNTQLFNELFGYDYTDSLLRLVVQYVRDILPCGHTIYRFAGNTFMVILRGDGGLAAKLFSETLLKRFSDPWRQAENDHCLDVALGIALYPQCGNNKDNIYRASMLAVKKAREFGSNSYAFYKPEFERAVNEEYKLAQELRQALSLNMKGFYLKYQPVFNLADGTIEFCEAFINRRTENTPQGFANIQPAYIMKLSQELGFDIQLDVWVAETACRFAARIQEELNFPDFSVNINITARELESGAALTAIKRATAKSGISPENLIIDIPEQVLSNNLKSSLKMAGKIKEFGAKIAIDNYGRDLFMPELLRSGAADYVKAEYSLFSNVFDEFDGVLLDTAVKLAKSVKGGLIVKRVEVPEQLETLKNYGISAIQGNLFKEPAAENEMYQFLRRYKNVQNNRTQTVK